METSDEYERKKLDDWEKKQVSRALINVLIIVIVLAALIGGMKMGVELSNRRIIKACDTKQSVQVRDNVYQCRKT